MITETAESEVVLSKGAYNILHKLTGESRPEVALWLAIKDLVRLSVKETQEQITVFEKKYDMNYAEFEAAWKDGRIKDPYSYPVEQDYMQWETALAELKLLEEIKEWLV
jgi:hypothetical protein